MYIQEASDCVGGGEWRRNMEVAVATGPANRIVAIFDEHGVGGG
jgi:hypothetical protein